MSVLAVAADVKPHLNITVTTFDAELQAILDAAEAAIVAKCGQLAATATTTRVRGQSDALVVSTLPAISLTSVTPVGSTALTVSDLMVSASGVIEYIQGGTFGARWYDVVYSAGRTLPKDLRLAVLELVRHLWDSQRGPKGRPGAATDTSWTTNAVTGGAGYLLPFRVQELIAPHLQPSFA